MAVSLSRDRDGALVDVMLSEHRDLAAARAFLAGSNGTPVLVRTSGQTKNIRLPLGRPPGGVLSGRNPVIVFRDLARSCPRANIIACDIDVLPAERGQMGEEVMWDLLELAQRGNGALKVSSVPKDDCGDEEVQAGGADAAGSRRLRSRISPSLWMNTARAEAVAVNSPLLSSRLAPRRSSGSSSQLSVNKVRSSRCPQFAQGRGDAILARV